MFEDRPFTGNVLTIGELAPQSCGLHVPAIPDFSGATQLAMTVPEPDPEPGPKPTPEPEPEPDPAPEPVAGGGALLRPLQAPKPTTTPMLTRKDRDTCTIDILH
jgi:hypothetical protein